MSEETAPVMKIIHYVCPECKATATSRFMRGPTCPNCLCDMIEKE